MTSYDEMLSGQPSKRGKMDNPERLLEYSVNPEEAVNFYQDCDPAEGENKEVVKRLRAKVAAVMTDSSSGQEETKGLDKRKGVKKAATDVSQTDVERCDDHPEEVAEYWCEEDCKVVCKDCLIFGDHRGHIAVKEDERGLAIMVDKVAKILPSLEKEFGRAQEIGKIVAVEGKELFNKVKEEIIELLDAKYEEESKRMFSVLSDHCSSLQKTITTIHSFKASLSSSQSPLLDPEEVAKFISNPLQLHMTPGTVAWHDTVLFITPPVLKVSPDSNLCSRSLTSATFVAHLLDRAYVDDRMHDKIISTDIMTVDEDIVKVMENGNPGQFYCRLVSTDTNMEMEEMEKKLLGVEEMEVYPSPGQGVLVRLEERWLRANLLGCDDKGWRCELVDIGQVVEGVKEVDMSNLLLGVLEIPAMAVRCSLAGLGVCG